MNRIFHPFRSASQQLGPLEQRLLEALWARRSATVRELVEDGYQNLAYTTVMTTLDRLFKKGLLDRQKSERAFLYSAHLSSQEWERRRAGDLVAGFLAGPQPSRELLLSSLVDAVGQHDALLLDELEEKIRRKRRELLQLGKP
jgi:predicted transcriptional regulator